MQEKEEIKEITKHLSTTPELRIAHAFGATFSSELKDSIHFIGDQQLLYPIGRRLGFRNIAWGQGPTKTLCGKIDEQLDKVTAITISSNGQCVALACKFLNDRSAYILFFDLTHSMKRYAKIIHEGIPRDKDDQSFISISFSADASRIATLTNIKMGRVGIYEWKKDVRILASCSWPDQLKKEAKPDEFADIRKLTMDPNNKEQICMTGKYHMRIWRNYNNLLKPLPQISKLDNKMTFTDHTWIDKNWLAVATEKGEIGFIYETRVCVSIISAFGRTVEPVSCLLAYDRGIIVGGESGLIAFWEKKPIGKKTEDEAVLKDLFQHQKNAKIESRGKIVSMALSSKPGTGDLAIAYRSNFIVLLKMSELLQHEEFQQKLNLSFLDEGYHLGRVAEETDPTKTMYTVMDMDVAAHRPLIATCCKTDSMLRIWNYLTFECEMVKCLSQQQSGQSPEPVRPLSIAFHPSGYILAGGFDTQAIIWHLMMDELRQFFVFQHYKNCAKVRFNHGGSMLAIAQMHSSHKAIFVHHTYSLEKLFTMKIPGNVMILALEFSEDDNFICCCCTDGVINIVNTITGEESMVYSSRRHIFPSCFVKGAQDVIVIGSDDTQRGILRRVVQEETKETIHLPNTLRITSACILNSSNFAIGTDSGLIRLYDYPNTTKEYLEFNMHSGPVSKLLISPNKEFIFSCGEDGIIFVYKINNLKKKEEETATIGVIDKMSEVVLVEKTKMQHDQKNLKKLTNKVEELEKERKKVEESLLLQHKQKLEELEIEKKNALSELESRLKIFREELSNKDANFSEVYKKMERKHQEAVLDLDTVYKAKIDHERKNYLNLEQSLREDMHRLKEALVQKDKDRELEIIQDHERNERDFDKLSSKLKEVKEAQIQAENKYQIKLTFQEEDHEKEMDQREAQMQREIHLLNETIRVKDDELNRVDTHIRELTEEKRELSYKNQDLLNLQEKLQEKMLLFQSEMEIAKKEKQNAVDEVKEQKESLIKIKAKYKTGVKDKQTLTEVAKELKNKLKPTLQNNTQMKTKIKEIQEEYLEYMEVIEQQKQASVKQESIVKNLRQEVAQRDKLLKDKEDRLKEIVDIIYKYRERINLDKNAYQELYKELYHKYVCGIVDPYTESPDVVDELHKQIKYLRTKGSSNRSKNTLKKRQLEKLVQGLRLENAKLLKELNEMVEKLNNSNRYQVPLEGKVKFQNEKEKTLRKVASGSINYARSPERSLEDIEKSSSIMRIASPKIVSSGKLYKGLAHQINIRKVPSVDKVSDLTQQLQECYDKIFQRSFRRPRIIN